MYVWTTTLLFLFSLANLLTFERLCNAPKQGARKAFVGTLSGHYTLWVLHFVGTTLCGYIYTLWALQFVGISTFCGYCTLWVYLHFVGTTLCGYIYTMWVLHFVGTTLFGYTLWVYFVGILCGYTLWEHIVVTHVVHQSRGSQSLCGYKNRRVTKTTEALTSSILMPTDSYNLWRADSVLRL
jgi:hypothetical protein